MRLVDSTDINPRLVKAKYAVRGAVPIRAGEIEADLRDPEKAKNYPFDKVIHCNIGNPQALLQAPLTFPRQVLSLILNPELAETCPDAFPSDVVDRAGDILDSFPGYSGAYTHSQGSSTVRESIRKFIKERDGIDVSVNTIFLTNGASHGVDMLLKLLIRSSNDGIMIPIPQYPLYSATIVLDGGHIIPYHLNEKAGWGLCLKELQNNYDSSVAEGIDIRAICCISPGNPTGNCLPRDQILGLLKFAKEHNLVVLADEVYQHNIYGDIPFHSFFSVAVEENIEVELVSFHSASKGFYAECGLRSGYMHLHNFSDVAFSNLYKLASIGLCPNICGQIIMETIVNPPKEGDPSYETWMEEKQTRLMSLKRRANRISSLLNELPGISCQPVSGALYAFPAITLPEKAVHHAEKLGRSADLHYCLELVEKAGICVIPGSGFGQPSKNGVYYFRTTILPPEESFGEVIDRFAAFHQDFLDRYQ
ncbi:hypothetical protein GEMRC1_006057 [Eukaryota sp. GEM-RC1]